MHRDRVRPTLRPVHPWIAQLPRTPGFLEALPPRGRFVVAVSGGCDSMLLLHAAAVWAGEFEWRPVVAHFHHGLRGPEADADQAFVAEAAAACNLPFLAGRGDVGGDARMRGDSIEVVAREMRHRFLVEAARRHDCDRIATGHHADDQVESFLLRLLRGAGPSGLAGMGIVDPNPWDPTRWIVRPWIAFPRRLLRQVAREIGIAWREDLSNGQPAHLRNRVRHELIPHLERDFQPALARVLQRDQTLLADQAALVEKLAVDWLANPARASFETLPRALQRETLRLQLLREGVLPTFDWIEALRTEPGVPFQYNPSRRFQRTADGLLEILPPTLDLAAFDLSEQTVELSEDSGSTDFAGLRVSWRLVAHHDGGAPRTGTPGVEWLDRDRLGATITLRHWRPGDRFQPLGLCGHAKLQDLFTNNGVPADARRARVVAATDDGEIFWVEGLRLGERASLTEATHRRLIWTAIRPCCGGWHI